LARRIVIFANNDFTGRKAGSHVRMSELAGFIEANFDNAIVYGFHEHPDSPWDKVAQQRFARQHPDLTLVLDHRTCRFDLFTRVKTKLLNLWP